MGVYDNAIYTTSESERINSLIGYLNNLNTDELTVISAESGTLEISGNTYTGASFSLTGTNISGFFGYSGLTATACYLKNGDNYLIPETARSYTGDTNLSVHSYVDKDCVLISINDLNSSRTGLEFVLLNTSDSKRLIGYKELLTDFQYVDISTLVFEELSDASRTQFSYTNMFLYAASIGKLDYLGQAYFVNGNNLKKFTADILRECSTVTLLSTASLVDGNWIALGAHCLAPLDSEEE